MTAEVVSMHYTSMAHLWYWDYDYLNFLTIFSFLS